MQRSISSVITCKVVSGLFVFGIAVLLQAASFVDHFDYPGDMPVPVWGKADPGETVRVSFAGQAVSNRFI